MHPSVMTWVAERVALHQLDQAGTTVLDVGCQDVNGNVRPLFAEAIYVGVDMRSGPGVDLVMDANDLDFPDATFDVVCSTEMLEHDRAFWLSMAEMGRVLRPGGHLLITARGNGFPLHEYPGDYYRFMPQGFEALLRIAGTQPIVVTDDPSPEHPGVFGHGVKL